MTPVLAQVAIEFDPVVATSFAVYLLIVVGIAFHAARNWTGTIDQFYLGGRKMRDFVVALSAVTSGRSAWLVLGVTGMAFVMGPSAVWAVVGYIVMEVFLFLFAAPRLRRFTGRMRDITLPDYFTSRFAAGNGLRALTVAVIVVFMIAYVSAQFAGGGKAFASTFGMEENAGIWLTALIVLLYTILGGYVAVTFNDVVQAFFMLFGLVVLPIVAIANVGWEPMLGMLQALDPELVDPYALGLGGLIGFLGIGLGSPGNPHILVRYMSIDDARQLRVSALWGTVWNVLMAWGAVFIGLVGRALYETEEALPGADTEQLFPFLADEFLPAIVVGFLVAAVFAAIMSTAGSQLLVGASGIVRDIYDRMMRKGEALSERHLVRLSRMVVLVMVLVATGLLYLPGAEDLVFWLVLFAWAGLGASFGPALLLSLFWRRTTAAGVVAGIITGAVVTLVWYYTPGLTDLMYELVPAFIASALAVVVVSLLTRPPEGIDEIWEDLRSGVDAPEPVDAEHRA
jgi:sodium/proline symporter